MAEKYICANQKEIILRHYGYVKIIVLMFQIYMLPPYHRAYRNLFYHLVQVLRTADRHQPNLFQLRVSHGCSHSGLTHHHSFRVGDFRNDEETTSDGKRHKLR